MLLVPTELERLTLFTAAELARKRRARGCKLNHPEAVALIADEILEGARDGRSVAELMSFGSTILSADDVMPGVPAMIPILQVEGVFPDGTKLVTIHEPVRPLEGGATDLVEPGALVVGAGDIELNAGRRRVTTVAVNTGDRPVQIGSHYHFFEVNKALQFDRALAFGMRLDIPAGTAVRFEPGQSKEISLVTFGGRREVTGFHGLSDGATDGDAACDAALVRARAGRLQGRLTMARMSRRAYAELYGPTTGDGFRLADTSLIAIVEKDYTVYGDECLHGGGKTLRDGAGLAAGVTSAQGALDMLLCNVVVIDAVLGVVKGDLGVRHGRIVGFGKAGNPAVMDGVDPRLIVSSGTTVRDCEGMIATAGAIDVHVHFDSAGLCDHAIASGITTMLGGSLGPITVGIDSGGPFNTGKMLQAAEAWPVNFGFLGRGNSHKPATLVEQMETGCLGLKLHEDWGSVPAAIDCCLKVADELDFQVQIHTDTLNESGFLEDTLAAIGDRTIHMYHTEGAGGGHAPDIIRVAGLANCLPSSTNPTNPYTVNTFDEHLDMTMVCHHLNPAIPEDVAFAESRIRPQTIAAEDVLHDIGAISMLGSDSQGMGRIHEVICRTWQLASKMKDQRGALPEEQAGRGDNARIRRYIAKYTINAARTFGIAAHVGSLEDGKMADIVLWRPAFFGIKPELVIKGGFIAWGAMGDSAASLMTCEPMLLRPQWGAFGRAAAALSACFVHPAAIAGGLGRSLGLTKALLPASGTRTLRKADMLWNAALPDIRVDPQTFDVFVDGVIATCAPATHLPLAQRYMLR